MKLTALAFLASSLFAQITGNLSGTISGTFSGTFTCTANCPTSGGSTGGSGSVTQIQQIVVSGTTTNAVTFAAIPGTFSNLQLIGSGRVSDNAASEYVMVQFNSDTAAHYNSQYSSGAGTVASAVSTAGVPQTSVTIASFPGATAPANQPGSMLAWLPNYSGTTFFKQALSQFGWIAGSSTYAVWSALVDWMSTAPITSITLTDLGGGMFIPGTTFTLYGFQ